MISQRLFLTIFLLSILLVANAAAPQEIIQWGHKIRKQLRKNESLTLRSPSLGKTDFENTIHINVQLINEGIYNFSYLRIGVLGQFDSQQKVILICDQIGNKQLGRCSIQLKSIKSFQQLKGINFEIISSVQSQIEVQIYLGRENRIRLGEEVILQSQQLMSDKQGDWQWLQLQVPIDIGQFQQIEFQLTSITGYPSSLLSQPSMTIYNAQSIEKLYKQQPLTTKNISSPSGVITYALSSSQVHPGDYILVNLTKIDRRNKYRFNSRISIKDKELNATVKLGAIDSYYQFQLGERDQLFIRYDHVFETIKGQQMEIIIHHFQNTINEVQVFTSTSRTQQNTLKFNSSSSPQSTIHIPLTSQNLQKLRSSNPNQPNHLYIKLSNKSPTSFYICLRISNNPQVIQKQWPEVLQLHPLKFNETQSNPTVTNHLNAQRLLFEDSIIIDSKSVSVKERQTYVIQVDYSMDYLFGSNVLNSLKLLVNPCSFLEFQSTRECLERTLQQQLQNNHNSPIMVRAQQSQRQKHKTIFSFEYQLSQCPIMTYMKQFSVHKCYFNLLLYTFTNSTQLKPFTFTLHKLPSLLPLTSQHQQLTSHYNLAAKSQTFFDLSKFSSNITRATVHLTTYFGDCIVFGSGEEKYPQYGLIEERGYNIGIGGFLEIDKGIKKQGYFVSVYCYEQSEFDIHAVTYSDEVQQKRFKNAITLREGYGEQFSLRGKDIIEFVFENSQLLERDFTIQIDQLQGGIQFQIHHINNNTTEITQITCPQQESREKTCRVKIPAQSKGYVSVWSRSPQITKFIIILKSQESQCHYYPSGRPQYILLQPQQKVCTLFRVTRYDDMQVSLLPLNENDLLVCKVQIRIFINNKSLQLVQAGRLVGFFSGSKIRQLCQSSSKDGGTFSPTNMMDCVMRVEIISLDTSINQSLIQTIEFVSSQTQLMNHINHMSSIDSLSKHYSKRLYYYIQQQSTSFDNQQTFQLKKDQSSNIVQANGVKLQVSSENDKDIVIVVRVQNAKRFEIQPDDYYPVYPYVQNAKQYVINLTNGKRFAEIDIPKQKLHCPLTQNLELLSDSQLLTKSNTKKQQCVLLISIFSTKLNPQQDQHFSYSIKITQGQPPYIQRETHQSSFNQPVSITTDTSQFSLSQISLTKLMWVIIVLSLVVLFLLLFIQRLCKLVKDKKNSNQGNIFKYEPNSPTIIISQPNINRNTSDSLADSYAFYPSPPSSSSDVIKAYEISQDDGIVELQEIKNHKRHNLTQSYPQLSSPTLR